MNAPFHTPDTDSDRIARIERKVKFIAEGVAAVLIIGAALAADRIVTHDLGFGSWIGVIAFFVVAACVGRYIQRALGED